MSLNSKQQTVAKNTDPAVTVKKDLQVLIYRKLKNDALTNDANINVTDFEDNLTTARLPEAANVNVVDVTTTTTAKESVENFATFDKMYSIEKDANGKAKDKVVATSDFSVQFYDFKSQSFVSNKKRNCETILLSF